MTTTVDLDLNPTQTATRGGVGRVQIAVDPASRNPQNPSLGNSCCSGTTLAVNAAANTTSTLIQDKQRDLEQGDQVPSSAPLP